MSNFADIAASILADKGEDVAYKPASAAAEAEPVDLQAVVTRHGLGYCPMGWPGNLFQNEARHAVVRLAPADVAAEPQREDVITLDGQDYRVRQVLRTPETGPEVLWWVCRCAAGQRGKY